MTSVQMTRGKIVLQRVFAIGASGEVSRCTVEANIELAAVSLGTLTS